MTLAEALARHVPERTRTKGNRYFLGGAVQGIDGSPTHVTATVRGTEWYQVHLTRTGDEVLASCGCPYFTDRYDFCKHIWAVVLAADVQGYLIGDSPITPDLYLESAYTDHGDEEDDWDAGGSPAAGWTSFGHSADTRPREPWERFLRAVQERSAHRAGVPMVRFRGGEILYVIGTDEAQPDLVPTVQVQWRTRRKSGEWGKPQPVVIGPSEIGELPDLLDREVVSLLLGAAHAYPLGAYASSLSARASFRLAGPLIERVLPLVAQSGRLHLRAETAHLGGFARDPGERFRPAPGPALGWDGGPPWVFRLEVGHGDPIVVNGSFVRGDEAVPVHAPSAMLAPGFLVMRGVVARADDRGALPWLQELRRTAPMRVPLSAASTLMETMARSAIDPADVPEPLRYEVIAVRPKPRVRITRGRAAGGPARNELDAVVELDYDGTIVPLAEASSGYDADARRMIRRDPAAEWAAAARLQQLGFHQPWHVSPRAHAFAIPVDRFPAAVRSLVEEGWFVEAEGRAIRAARGMEMQVRSGVDWFELHGHVDFGGREPVPVAELLAALRRGDATIVLDDGTRGMLPEAWLRRYARVAAFGEPRGDHVRYVPSQAALLDALLDAQPSVSIDEAFARARAQLAGFEGVSPIDPPPGFRGRLRAYQRDALGWFAFLRRFGFGGCLADDMGLGKTVMVLALLESRRSDRERDAPRTSVVVVPRSLVFNWMDEAARFAPDLRVLDYTGEARAAVPVEEHDILLTTYGTLRRDIARLSAQAFDYVILDEAQAIKNPSTASAKAARLLRGRHRLALSGTPVENHLGELWSLFEFLNPGFLGGNRRSGGQEEQEGEQEIRRSGEQEGNGFTSTAARIPRRQAQKAQGLAGGWQLEAGSWQPDGGGRKLDVAVAARALRPFILRRTKAQVAPELPDRIEQTIHCELEPPQRRFYDGLLTHYRETLLARVAEKGLNRSKMHVLEALLRLRQAASHPGLVDARRVHEPSAKFEVLIARLREVADEGHKALVFSQFTTLLGLLRVRLDAEGIRYEYLDGRTRDRAERVARFESDEACPLFLISLKAGGLGLNLTAAGYVFLLDPWWNPAVEAQAIDRAHRIGQSKHVFAYRLIARDTVEEKIAELQQSKRELADAILTEDSGILRTLGPDELAWLLE